MELQRASESLKAFSEASAAFSGDIRETLQQLQTLLQLHPGVLDRQEAAALQEMAQAIEQILSGAEKDLQFLSRRADAYGCAIQRMAEDADRG